MQPLLDNLAPWAQAWAALTGAVLGSFLNVVVARVPAGLSVVHPRSRCPRCHTPIAWYDNVPVLSWILLRARCRACHLPISVRYPLVELAAAGLAVLALRRHGISGAFAAELAFALVLLCLALIDLDTWLLPNALTWPLLGGGLLVSALGVTPAGGLLPAVYGAGVGFAAFAAIAVVGERVFRREAMGFGDVWLLAGLGAFLGVGALLPVVLLASLQGTVVGLALAALGKLPKGEERAREAGAATATAAGTAAETATPTATATATATETATGTEAAAGTAAATATAAETATATETTATAIEPTATEAVVDPQEEDWVPPRNAVPFGPFLVAGALEWLYLGDAIARLVPTLELFR